MKKILHWITQNPLLLITLFLLVFIPLYPKLPLLDVRNTWVYIRIEDILVAFAVAVLGLQLLRRKATLNTPLSIPIFSFWIVGLVSLVIAIVFIFPMLINVYPEVAVLHYLRRIEYLVLFFIAFNAIRNKKDINLIIIILTLTLFAVCLYGFGQKGILVGWENRFPAFSTMNEEFAKGIPLKISALGRISSTFAGHYDLAAYLVMLIPIMGALAIGLKRWWMRITVLLAGTMGLVLLMMTSSRVSFAVYLLTIVFMLVIHKKKLLIIPVVILSLVLLQSFEGLSSRYASTISSVDVVVDARTGQAIGIAKPGSTDETGKIVVEEKDLTGEDLPQGSGYINLPNDTRGSASKLRYERTKIRDGKTSTTSAEYEGEYVVRRALAYDVSFTTRFQGTWPRAIDAFKRNIFTGSGYSSISLASDNNYLRILGEVGLFGFLSFVSIFIFFGIVVRKALEVIPQGKNRSFLIGVSAGVVGVALNAVLIDVFEASKVAFMMWSIMGAAVALAGLYLKDTLNIWSELKKLLLSLPALILYLFLVTIGVFSMIVPNFFVGDDFTWLRWAAECVQLRGGTECANPAQTILTYFTTADNFFYRPGTKIYFFIMFAIFWLHQAIYHYVSIFLHFAATAAVLLLTYQLLGSKRIAAIASVLFLVLSVHFEQVYWIAATGHLVAAAGVLWSVVLYIAWRKTGNIILLLASFGSAFASMFFHEFGVVVPLLLLAYDLLLVQGKRLKDRLSSWVIYAVYGVQVIAYLILRYTANSHWQGGDYSYNIVKLPFNVIGNTIGYFGITVFGTAFRPLYDALRTSARENMISLAVGAVVLIALVGIVIAYRQKLVHTITGRIFVFGFLFFMITLLPFLGLGNITYRYAYLPSAGLILMVAAIINFLVTHVKSKLIWLVIVVVLGAYGVYQYFELVRINKDWVVASNVTRSFVNDIDRYFTPKDILPKNSIFYFLNVPIMYRNAWIFPVGLEDAIFLPFQSNPPQVIQIPEVNEELIDRVNSSKREFLFEFAPDGSVTVIGDTAQ